MAFSKRLKLIFSSRFSRLSLLVFLFLILIFNGGVHPVARLLLLLSPAFMLFLALTGPRARALSSAQVDRGFLALWLAILLWAFLTIPSSWAPGLSIRAFFVLLASALFSLFAAGYLSALLFLRWVALTLVVVAALLLLQRVRSLFLISQAAGVELDFLSAVHGHSHISDILVLISPLAFAHSLTSQGRLWRWVLRLFLVGMEKNLFPHSRSMLEKDELEEERRLCYVGITRAQQQLFLTYARRRLYFGIYGSNIVSRFLGEIPEELLSIHYGSAIY